MLLQIFAQPSSLTYILLFGTLALVSLVGGVMLFIIVLNAKERKHQQIVFANQLIQTRLEIQEQTCNHISSELHDNVGQLLSLAKIQLNILDHTGTFDRGMLTEAKDSINRAMTDLRDIARSLSSTCIQSTSLVDMTNHELQRIQRLGSLQVHFHLTGTELLINEQKKLLLLRILQEGLQNILKHSSAASIRVYLDYAADHLEYVIEDDGIGFDSGLPGKGLGLQNIVNRAHVLGGKAQIASSPGKGTRITVRLPYLTVKKKKGGEGGR